MFFTIKERCLFRKQRKTIKTSHIKTQSWSSCATHCSYYLLYICVLKCISAVCNCVFSRFRNIQFYYYFVQSSASLHSPQVWCFHSKQDWLRFEWKTNPDSSFVTKEFRLWLPLCLGQCVGQYYGNVEAIRVNMDQHGNVSSNMGHYMPHMQILSDVNPYWPMMFFIDPCCPILTPFAHIDQRWLILAPVNPY